MGDKDITEKILESYNDVFADIVNGIVFNGEQVVREEDLVDATPFGYFKASGKVRAQERDIAKRWMNGNICISLIGLENQTRPDPYMPIRVLQYDAAAYRAQIPKAGRKPVYPVMTIVLYCGYKRRWNGPRTLHRMLGLNITEQMIPFINDYRMNLVELAWMSEEEINRRFHGDFRIFANHLMQKRRNREYVPDAQVMRHAREVLQLLSVMEHDHRYEDAYNSLVQRSQPGEGGWNMCDVMDKAVNSGIEKGRAEERQNSLHMLYDLVAGGDLPIAAAVRSASNYGVTDEADFRMKAVEMGIRLPE